MNKKGWVFPIPCPTIGGRTLVLRREQILAAEERRPVISKVHIIIHLMAA